MAKVNTPKKPIYTHEGGRAKAINPEQQLRRSVMACMLWEKEFYEDGETIADRIKNTIPKVKAEVVAQIAIEARHKMHLRHVPLLIVREMARLDSHKSLVAKTLPEVINRADELAEFLAIYWSEGKQPLSAQVKKGLANSFGKFNEYQLAKYNRDGTVKLRDVLFLCHARPVNSEQKELWAKLVDDKLEIPDTWEVALSTGGDKTVTWERLIKEKKLGGLAFLRNLRNMQQAGVDESLISEGLSNANTDKVLPFRFIAAARYAPDFEPFIEAAMLKSEFIKMPGNTTILVDVSGSMDQKLSLKSDMTRMDAACGVAIVAREMFDSVKIRTFSDQFKEVPARRGFALRDAITESQEHRGTYLGRAVSALNQLGNYDRLIVVTDEQSHDPVPDPKGVGYVINVASDQNGVGYGKWIHIDGFSEAVLNYIAELEKTEPN